MTLSALNEAVEQEGPPMTEQRDAAASTFQCWWAMVEAGNELDGGEPFKDDDIVLNYMGNGASCHVTAKDIREFITRSIAAERERDELRKLLESVATVAENAASFYSPVDITGSRFSGLARAARQALSPQPKE